VCRKSLRHPRPPSQPHRAPGQARVRPERRVCDRNGAAGLTNGSTAGSAGGRSSGKLSQRITRLTHCIGSSPHSCVDVLTLPLAHCRAALFSASELYSEAEHIHRKRKFLRDATGCPYGFMCAPCMPSHDVYAIKSYTGCLS
jgi:hypothetical protein